MYMHVIVHCGLQLPLTWEAAVVLLEFYHPSFLPAVEENKTLTPEVGRKRKRREKGKEGMGGGS